MSHQDFAPFFHNGQLCFPAEVVDLLAAAGLNAELVEAARRGIPLHERDKIADIERVLLLVIERLPHSGDAYEALTSEDARFMLTGFPVETSAPFAARIGT